MTEVINETDYDINVAEFSALADYVLDQMHVSSDAEVNIIFIEPEPMEELHVRWLDLPGPTDVMSFPMDELKPGTADHPTPPGMLGDICICPQVPARRPSPATAPPRRCSCWRPTECSTSWATTTPTTPSARSCLRSSASSC